MAAPDFALMGQAAAAVPELQNIYNVLVRRSVVVRALIAGSAST